MRNQVFCDQPDPFFRPNHGLQTGPLRSQPLLLSFFLTFGNLFKLRINSRSLLFQEFYLGQPPLIVDGNGGSVLDRAKDVIGVNVITEYRWSTPVIAFEGSCGKANERGVRQGVPHVPGKSVNEIVLAPVRFVSDDNDVLAPGKHGLTPSLSLSPPPPRGGAGGGGGIFVGGEGKGPGPPPAAAPGGAP